MACVIVIQHDDQRRQERYTVTARRQIASLDKLPKPDARKAPVVVVLGHSLIWAALQRDPAQRRTVAGTDLVVLTADFKHPHWFEALLPALRRLHPDLLVVDSELLGIEITVPTFGERVNFLMRTIWPPKAQAATGCPDLARKPITSATVNHYQGWFNPKAMELDRLPTLAALKSEGIAVDVLQMPRSDALELAAPNLIEWRKAEAALVENQGIGVWTPSGDWPEADYCDHAHMSLAGAAQFNAWFGERLTRTFNLSLKAEP
jgi:hypothetical protein